MKLLAVDGNSILNRAYYGVKPLTAKDGTPTNAIYGFLNILFKLEKDFPFDLTVIAFDVSRKTFRNELFSDYKANRKGMPEDLAVQLPIVKELLTLMGYNILEKEGFEGDDILGTISNMDEHFCIVATGDRDCLQLIDDNTSVALIKTKETILYDVDKVKQDFLVAPKQIIDLKALMGDASDNIPGVKGIGEKTAIGLLNQYPTIEELYQNIQQINATDRIKNLLLSNKDMAFTSYKLATIKTDVDITLPTQQNAVNEEELRNKLQSLDLYSVMQKFGLSQEKQQEEIKPQLKTTNVLSISELPQDEYTFVLYSKEQVRILSKDKQYVTDNIKSVLEYLSDKKIVTHKAKELYKQFIIANIKQYDIFFDTEIASYLLNPDLKAYDIKELSNQEDEMCGLVTLFTEYKAKLKSTGMEKLFFEIEMPLCEVLSDMELTGVKIDKQGVEHFGEKLKAEIDSLVKEIHILADEQFNINSTKELGAILFEKLKLPAKKKTKTGYSTGAEVLEELVGIHPIIELVLKYRQLAKLHSTYVIGLLKVIAEDGRIHSTFNQTETRTGRISSTEPNMQNIPIRTPLGSEMRKFFVAESGYSLIDADYSQIELRLLAHIADDKVMIKAFKDGADIHSTTAAEVFNVETPTQEQRSRAKAINFGIVYGIGAFSLSKDINVSVKEAKEYIEAYLQTYTGVKNYMEQVVKDAEYNGYVTTLYGRRRYLPDINAKNKMLKAFSARVALNAPIQGTAADIIKLAMIKVYKRIKKENLDAKLILQVHDELIIEAPLMQQDYVKKILKEEMENASDIFLVADVNSGENWFLAH